MKSTTSRNGMVLRLWLLRCAQMADHDIARRMRTFVEKFNKENPELAASYSTDDMMFFPSPLLLTTTDSEEDGQRWIPICVYYTCEFKTIYKQ